MPELKLGSDEHRALFCRAFVETHHAYEPQEVEWPDIDDASVERLRSLPFWGEAIGSERTAAASVRAMADVETDPEMRDAIALQAYEEERHAVLLENLLARYGIDHPDTAAEMPRDPEWGFVRMGYGECFDSFFAFGLFKVASDTGFFVPPLVRIFDGVMQEEARHILFFSNWAAYRGHRLALVERPWFLVRRMASVGLLALGRVRTALQLGGSEARDDFTMQVPDAIGGADLTLVGLARTCVAENERRLAPFDRRLLRPKIVPTLVGLALKFAPGPRG